MITNILGATALLLMATAAQAQGVVSPVANPQPAAEPATAEAVAPARPATGGSNPFAPKAPPAAVVEEDANLPVPVDPTVAALAEELQTIREQGERLGVVDGKIIFRHEGRYLVEALAPDGIPEGTVLDVATRESMLAGECLIRIGTLNPATPNNNPATAQPAANTP